jgi:hypothetical protein
MNANHKVRVGLALFLVVLLFASVGIEVVFRAQSVKEPSINGLTLTDWLEKYIDVEGRDAGFPKVQANNNECRNAVRAMGTNSIPCVLAWIQMEDTPIRKQITRALNMVLPIKHRLSLSEDRNRIGGLGFKLLGEEGQSAIPGLIELTKSNNPRVRLCALQCLWVVGASNPILLPVIERTKNDPDQRVQIYSRALAVEMQFRPEAEGVN